MLVMLKIRTFYCFAVWFLENMTWDVFVCVELAMQRPHKAYPVELAQFHSEDYVEFLHRITPDTQHLFAGEMARCVDFSLWNLVKFFSLFVLLSICCFCLAWNELGFMDD